MEEKWSPEDGIFNVEFIRSELGVYKDGSSHSVIGITIMKLWYLQIMIVPSSLWTVNGQALVKY